MNLALMLLLSVLPSPLKLAFYRLRGMHIGRGVRIGFGTLLLCHDVVIADGARIGAFCLIRVDELRLGKRSLIANFNRITVHRLEMKSQSIVFGQNEISGTRGDRRSTIHIGPASAVLPHCFINVARPIRIGRNVGIGGGSYLFTHGMWLSKLDGFPVSYGEIVLEDDVWLPWGCFILPNVTVGSRAIIGARSVVNRSIPSGVLAAGVPAKVVRDKSNVDLDPAARAEILAEITESLAARKGLAARIERAPERDVHFLDGSILLVLHKRAGAARSPLPVLNVIYEPLDAAEAASLALWSLSDYASSPFALLPARARDWFEHAREVGVRFYPVDEDQA